VASPRVQAYLAFSLQADLTSAFSWNTKLLFVYLAAEYATPFNQHNQARLRACARCLLARCAEPARARAPAQVSLWDRIIETKEDARFSMPFVRNKYKLQDQVSALLLRGVLQRAADWRRRAAGAASARAQRQPDAVLERDADRGPAVYGASHVSHHPAAVRVRFLRTARARPSVSAHASLTRPLLPFPPTAGRYTRMQDGAGLRTLSGGGGAQDRIRQHAAAAAAASRDR
jgi:hypothetical protein